MCAGPAMSLSSPSFAGACSLEISRAGADKLLSSWDNWGRRANARAYEQRRAARRVRVWRSSRQ